MAVSSPSTLSTRELDRRAIYSGSSSTMRYYLNTFTSITPWTIGNSLYSMGALYKHAIDLLLQMSTEQPQSPSLGLHLDQLSLTFTTTSGVPIPWDTALYFIRRMLAFLDRRLIGPEFQAFITDIALDVTIEVSLRLLLDGPLPAGALDD
ncbi:MAG: hypothetical protein LQ341_005782 [Variospora aurantia]|nr:MAG: hypothetical protein LQ341_005782 [Variospora aurantia]